MRAVLLVALCVATAIDAQPAPRRMRSTHVILVITDGFRWQELFGGADSSMIGSAGRVSDTASLRRAFWRETPSGRRAALLPFVWGTIAERGQIFGDSMAGSPSTVTNGLKFSYPGYSEAFTGHVDPRIDSNEHPPNENRTVFEWLNTQPPVAGKVAAFATWSAFRRIINAGRSHVPVYDGWDNGVAPTGTPRAAVLRNLFATTNRLWADNALDALTHQATLDYMVVRKPRVLFIGYGETDEWAHDGRYDLYLRSAHQVDAFLAELWSRAQADPVTRDRTTLIVTTDHGRGQGARWRDHGQRVDGAERIWIAAIGPDIPALGVRTGTPSTQSQVASSIAAVLGLDWPSAEPRAAKALPLFGTRP
jgi:hypothetical protein